MTIWLILSFILLGTVAIIQSNKSRLYVCSVYSGLIILHAIIFNSADALVYLGTAVLVSVITIYFIIGKPGLGCPRITTILYWFSVFHVPANMIEGVMWWNGHHTEWIYHYLFVILYAISIILMLLEEVTNGKPYKTVLRQFSDYSFRPVLFVLLSSCIVTRCLFRKAKEADTNTN